MPVEYCRHTRLHSIETTGDLTMNTDRINRIAEHLEHSCQVRRFDMNVYFDDCNSPCCIAGHTACYFEPQAYHDAVKNDLSGFDIHLIARKALGLNAVTADMLFCPDRREYKNAYRASRQQAAAVLKKLASTGRVVWPDA